MWLLSLFRKSFNQEWLFLFSRNPKFFRLPEKYYAGQITSESHVVTKGEWHPTVGGIAILFTSGMLLIVVRHVSH